MIGPGDQKRFFRAFQVTPACWVWTRGRKDTGYGVFWLAGALRAAHRVSYEIHHGPIPPGLIVRHRCDNPPCVNPDHLVVGTFADNMAGMVARGRARGKVPGPCRNGHAESFRHYSPRGEAVCRECRRLVVARWRRKRAG